jgi:hypothetical protein
MKSLQTPLFALVLVVICLAGCTKHNSTPTPTNPIDQLPPATQTGANTFGCLVNGQAFLPSGSLVGGPSLFCTYEYLNNNFDTGYFLNLSASMEVTSTDIASVSIGTDSLTVSAGNHYVLQQNIVRGNASAQYSISSPSYSPYYTTTNQVVGDLYLSRFDLAYQIASGTFWFNAIDANGDTVKVTNGRFDMQFSR